MTISSLIATSATMSENYDVISTAVLAKSLDTFEQSGEAIVQMMEQSVNPNIGMNFDMKV